MNYKRIGGIISILIGVVFLGYGIYGSYRMHEARQDIDSKTKYVPGQGFRGAIQKELHNEVDKYKGPVLLCYIGGVVFLLGGLFFVRGSSKR
jgi:hypothetical protein